MTIKRFLFGVVLVPILGFIGFSIWAFTPLGPMQEALEALESTPRVNVERNSWIRFSPNENNRNVGVIIYPGGRVDPRSYAPAAKMLAENGYFAVIVPMPFNLAILGSGKAQDVMEHFQDINSWVMSGHSLGGSMATRYTLDNDNQVDGLVLWAAYPASADNLSSSNLSTASIFGTKDGLVNDKNIQHTIASLPESNQLIIIEGGNHAQFGWYGDQNGDNPAAISRERQQKLVVDATISLVKEI